VTSLPSGAIQRKAVRRPLGPDAAPHHRGVDAEQPQDLRHLRRVPELIRHVAEQHAAAERLGAADAVGEVPHQRLARDHQRIGLREPRADVQAPGLDQRADARLHGRPQLQVVLDHGHLAVEGEGQSRVLLEQLDRFIEHLDEAGTEDLEGLVPLAIPVGVCDQGDAIRSQRLVHTVSHNQHACHAPRMQPLLPRRRPSRSR
jgi:hypothetical protein